LKSNVSIDTHIECMNVPKLVLRYNGKIECIRFTVTFCIYSKMCAVLFKNNRVQDNKSLQTSTIGLTYRLVCFVIV